MTSNYTPPNLVTPTPNGAAGDGSLKGTLTIRSADSTSDTNAALSFGSAQTVILHEDGFGNLYTTGNVLFGTGPSDSIYVRGYFGYYRSVSTSGTGVPPIYGLDNRTGLTAADTSATTLYTTTAASQVYRVTARVFGKSGTISSAVYTIGWTEGGTSMTETVSISAVSTMDSAVFLLQPDDGKAITVQLTTLSGTSPVVDVAATLEQMA